MADIAYATDLGYVIKLLARAREVDGEIEIAVRPTMIPHTHPLASVHAVYNAIFVEGDACGEVMFFGEGAGSFAAGSSVVGDIVDAAKNIQMGTVGRTGCTCFDSKTVRPVRACESRYYMLLRVADRPGVLAAIAGMFGNAGVSLASVVQKESTGEGAELVFMTYRTEEGRMQDAVKGIKTLDVVTSVVNVLAVEERSMFLDRHSKNH